MEDFLAGIAETVGAALSDSVIKGLLWGGGFVLGVCVLISLLS